MTERDKEQIGDFMLAMGGFMISIAIGFSMLVLVGVIK